MNFHLSTHPTQTNESIRAPNARVNSGWFGFLLKAKKPHAYLSMVSFVGTYKLAFFGGWQQDLWIFGGIIVAAMLA